MTRLPRTAAKFDEWLIRLIVWSLKKRGYQVHLRVKTLAAGCKGQVRLDQFNRVAELWSEE